MSSSSTLSSSSPLSGKVAIVTGSSRGIGAAIAKRLAADGAVVAINYVKSEQAALEVVEEIKKAGGEAHAFKADVSVRDQVFALVDEVVGRWGGLDILVNNSGVAGSGFLEQTTEEEVDRLFGANFKGTLWGLQAAAKVLKSGGAIVNLSSVLANKFSPTFGVYGASKSAIEHITKTAAKELGPRGIRVNAVAPGLILTDMSKDIDREQIAKQTPLENRVGTLEEVASVVAFLASNASSWVTGEIITLAGAF